MNFLRELYCGIHDDRLSKDPFVYLLTSNGTLLCTFAGRNSLFTRHADLLLPGLDWFIDGLPLSLPAEYRLPDQSAIAVPKKTAIGLRTFTQNLILQGDW